MLEMTKALAAVHRRFLSKERLLEDRNKQCIESGKGGTFGRKSCNWRSIQPVDHTGKLVTEKNFLGKWTILYFGFTLCPDICPDELQKLAVAVDKIEENLEFKWYLSSSLLILKETTLSKFVNMLKKRKQRRVPEALWRVYHNRVRTLAGTILSFLPSPPPSPAVCPCKGRRCLGCAGDKALPFLLGAKDPPEYQKLLKKCFVVVDDSAPPFPGFDPCRRWHHHEIIKRSIEMIMSEQSTSSNLLCCGFDKRSRTSDTVELLDSSSWRLLLKRVGDIFMVYLLKNTSIFIPLPQRKYLQIAGFPISTLCQRLSNDLSCSRYRHFSQSIHGHDKKKKVSHDADRRSANIQGSSSARVDFQPSVSGSIIGLSELTNASQSSKHCGEQSYHETLEVNDSSKSHEKSIQSHKMSRKRKRPTSWQRRQKHRQLNSVATNSEISEIEPRVNDIELVKEEKQEISSARVDLHSNFSGSIIGCSKTSGTLVGNASVNVES